MGISLNMLNKVLIIDDSEELYQFYKTTLRRYKYEIVTAWSREEGLSTLIEDPEVNLVFVDMDMSLSCMSGLEFMQKVKEQQTLKDIPIVVVSTYNREDNIEEALALAYGNLTKPFMANEIHALIERLSPVSAYKPKTMQPLSLTLNS